MGSSRPVVIGRMGDGKTCSQRAIEERVMAAIRPQLSQLRDLEKHHQDAARIERLRRQHKMWDAHDSVVEAYDMGQAIGSTYRMLKNKLMDTWQTVTSAWAPIIESLEAGARSQQPSPADPVPADQHAGRFGYIPAGVYPARRQ